MGCDERGLDGRRSRYRGRAVIGVRIEACRIDMLESLVDVGCVGYLCCLR